MSVESAAAIDERPQRLDRNAGCGIIEPTSWGHRMAMFDRRSRYSQPSAEVGHTRSAMIPGKQTLTSQLPVQHIVEHRSASSAIGAEEVHAAAERGTSGPAERVPHLATIQQLFGSHDVTRVQAHTDAHAREGSAAMGAQAFARGEHVAFAGTPDLHTAAHEAAHVVQQRAGVHLKGGVGQESDNYERHADAVADRVVRGESAEALLSLHSGPATTGGAASAAVQQTRGQKRQAPAVAEKAAKEGKKRGRTNKGKERGNEEKKEQKKEEEGREKAEVDEEEEEEEEEEETEEGEDGEDKNKEAEDRETRKAREQERRSGRNRTRQGRGLGGETGRAKQGKGQSKDEDEDKNKDQEREKDKDESDKEPTQPTTQQRWASWAKAVLQESFRDYKQISEGTVMLLKQAEFQGAYDGIYGGGNRSWATWVKPTFGNLAGFACQGLIYINVNSDGNRSSHGIGATVVHEMLHNNAAADWKESVGSQFNEGATELMTQYALYQYASKHTINMNYTPTYRDQVECVKAFLKTGVKPDVLFRAYLQGGASHLIGTHVNSTCRGNWKQVVAAMEKKEWAAARVKLACKELTLGDIFG